MINWLKNLFKPRFKMDNSAFCRGLFYEQMNKGKRIINEKK